MTGFPSKCSATRYSRGMPHVIEWTLRDTGDCARWQHRAIRRANVCAACRALCTAEGAGSGVSRGSYTYERSRNGLLQLVSGQRAR